MGGKIDIYLDIASLYSYVAFTYLQQHASELAAHGVEIDYHPVLLGGINASTGNKPPWFLPAKATYLKSDIPRSLSRVSLPPNITMPPNFLTRANTLLPLRCLTCIKSSTTTTTTTTTSSPQYLAAFGQLFKSFWIDHSNLTDPTILSTALLSTTFNFLPIFTPSPSSSSPSPNPPHAVQSLLPIDAILHAASTSEVKEAVRGRTQEAIDKGAFGAPWIWATDSAGNGASFFGSDRFHFVYEHLGVPFEDVKILPPPREVVAGGGKGGGIINTSINTSGSSKL